MKTVQEKLKECVTAMNSEQFERFEEKTTGRNLQDWEKANIAETILGPRTTITEVAPKHVPKKNGAEPITEAVDLREQQFNAFRKSGFTEAEAVAMSGHTPKK
jgi:hypothetical protein